MSSNRLIYDTCAYAKDIEQSVGPLAYVLNPMKYENCNKCRHELGLVSGPAVSHIKGNLVDLENDLRGATREASLCPSKHFQAGNPNITVAGKACGKPRNVDTNLMHLPSCQMIRYKPTPLPPPLNLQNCPAPNVGTPNACGNLPCRPQCN